MAACAAFVLILVQLILRALAARPAVEESQAQVARHNHVVDPRWQQMFVHNKGEQPPEQDQETPPDLELTNDDAVKKEEVLEKNAGEGEDDIGYWKVQKASLEAEIDELKRKIAEALKNNEKEEVVRLTAEEESRESALKEVSSHMDEAPTVSKMPDLSAVPEVVLPTVPGPPQQETTTFSEPAEVFTTTSISTVEVVPETGTADPPIALPKDGELEDTDGPLKAYFKMTEPAYKELRKLSTLADSIQWFICITTMIIGALFVFCLHSLKHKATCGVGTLLCTCFVPGGFLALCLPVDESPPPTHDPIFDQHGDYDEEPWSQPKPQYSQEVPPDDTGEQPSGQSVNDEKFDDQTGTPEEPSLKGVPGEAPSAEEGASKAPES